MNRRLTLEWPTLGLSVTAELDQRNPALADALWDALPYRSLQGHALVAGHHLFHVAPIHQLLHLRGSQRVDRRTAPDGTIFCSRLQHLGIKYGDLTEPMPATPVGQVAAGDVERLARVGAAVWSAVYQTKEPIPVEVRQAGEGPWRRPDEQDNGIPRLPASDPLVDELIGDLHTETDRIWLQAPAELVDLHAGLIASGAGSYGTKLTTMLFVNGETRPLGYNVYSGLVQAARQGMPLDSLRQMARLFGAVPAEFLAYCGLQRLGDFTDRLMDCLQHLDPGQDGGRDDFIALMSHMALYINCLGGWNLHLFPWHLDDQLRSSDRQGVALGQANDQPSDRAVSGRTAGRRNVPRQAGEPAGEESLG